MTALGKYMFVSAPRPSASGITKIWEILDTHDGILGRVHWFGRWRCYAFHPMPATVYNAACMEELAKFCDTQTKVQRTKK